MRIIVPQAASLSILNGSICKGVHHPAAVKALEMGTALVTSINAAGSDGPSLMLWRLPSVPSQRLCERTLRFASLNSESVIQHLMEKRLL